MAKGTKAIDRDELKSNLDELFSNVENFRETGNFQQMLAFVSSFKSMSPYNAFLLYQQRPGTRYVLNASSWLKKYSRKIKPNARPLIILVPFGPVDYVYDISDTYPVNKDNQPSLFAATDEEILNELIEPFKTSGYVPNQEISKLVDSMAYHGIAFENNLRVGNDFAGQIEILEGESHHLVLIYKKCNLRIKANYLLSVRDKASVGESFATIVHELGHFFCHHLTAYPKDSWKLRNLDHITEEFEAEAVSYIICSRFGVSSPSADYLNSYYKNNKLIPSISLETVFTACNQILNMINGLTLKQGLLYKYDKEFKKMIDGIKDH